MDKLPAAEHRSAAGRGWCKGWFRCADSGTVFIFCLGSVSDAAVDLFHGEPGCGGAQQLAGPQALTKQAAMPCCAVSSELEACAQSSANQALGKLQSSVKRPNRYYHS